MIAILSPAKTLDFKTKYDYSHYTISDFLTHRKSLIKELKKIT